VVTLTAKSGYTFAGVAANAFSYTGATSVTNAANSGTVTITFPATAAAPAVVNALNLTSLVTAPVAGASPVSTAINAAQYTGTIAWQTSGGAAHTGAFGYSTVYKAVVTLTAKSGYTFAGVAANAFSYTGASSVTNAVNSGTVTITFPATGANSSPVSIEMVNIPGGTFTMGSPESEPERWTEETQHQVTVSAFRMGKYEVTQEQWEAVMGSNPSFLQGSYHPPASGEVQGKRPVEGVNWYNAIVFCNKLSIQQGLTPAYTISGSTNPDAWGTVPTSQNSTWNAVTCNWNANGYRLPTEAEWEYACRAGTTTAYYTGNVITDSTGWYGSNSGLQTHEVGKKPANAWGLYDMAGNVWEWCWDWYAVYPYASQTSPRGPSTGSDRVIRGGSRYINARGLRSAVRGRVTPRNLVSDLGFRLARSGS
jgi:formylglycine-generating enzyme required for sulfatase activity